MQNDGSNPVLVDYIVGKEYNIKVSTQSIVCIYI